MFDFSTLVHVWLQSLALFAGFAVVFLVLTKWTPCNPGQNWWQDPRAALTDLIYWLVLPLITQLGRLGFLVLGTWLLYDSTTEPNFLLRSLPIALQCLLILLIQDVLMYWLHRGFHTRFAWKFHAVHHSPEVLDWTATTRFHPVNILAEFALVDAIILLMGFSPMALVILGPINLIYSVMVHANLNWTFGPFRHVLASPVFHRWHHTSETEGRDCNFAPTFPFLDHLWGTFAMPEAKRPTRYGINEPDFPQGYLGQLLYPFQGLGSVVRAHPGKFALLFAGLLGAGAMVGNFLSSRGDPAQAEIIPDHPGDLTTPSPSTLASAPMAPATALACDLTGRITAWGAQSGQVVIRQGGESRVGRGLERRVNAVAVSPDGAWIAGGDGAGLVVIWNTLGDKMLTIPPGSSVVSLAVNNRGDVAIGRVEGRAEVWSATGDRLIDQKLTSGAINAIALAEREAILGLVQGTRVYRATRDRLEEFVGLRDLGYRIALNPEGTRLAVGEYTGRLLVWEPGSSRIFAESAEVGKPVYGLRYLAEGELLVGYADGAVTAYSARFDSVRHHPAPASLPREPGLLAIGAEGDHAVLIRTTGDRLTLPLSTIQPASFTDAPQANPSGTPQRSGRP
jgi:sterol desaturase/sphingolipid hydroxylase (fatty acid hydroxylase superfamily)